MSNFTAHYRHNYLVLLALLMLVNVAWAGGAPLNVLLIVNGRSSESLEIGNLYRRARDIPYRQVLVLDIEPTDTISYPNYLEHIEQPIRAYLQERAEGNDITTFVLTRGVPQQVALGNGRSVASLLAALDLPKESNTTRVANPFLNSPVAFSHRPDAFKGMYLVTVLHGYNTADIRQLIAQGSTADGTAPSGRYLLHTGPNVPSKVADTTVDLLTQRGLSVERLSAPPVDRTAVMGYFSGGVYSGVTRDLATSLQFRPGALADLVQNFSASPNNFDEASTPVLTPVSWFVAAGVSGIHGVVSNEGSNAFPALHPQQALLDRYTAGFSLAESYYAALPYLNWQNIVIGDPLCAPYAQRPSVSLDLDAQPVTGMIPIRATATSPKRGETISRMALYLDDVYQGMMYEPVNTRITLRIGETSLAYLLPAGATLRSLLEGIADAINNTPELMGADGVRASVLLHSGTLRLIARTPGPSGNTIPVTVTVEGAVVPGVSSVRFRVDGGALAGGGQEPVPAKATLSFIGRQVAAGDTITLHIKQERLTYRAPDDQQSISSLLEALVALVESTKTLQGQSGVRAYRAPNNMPYLVIEARTPGESGNRIPFRLTVQNAPGSKLRGYPDSPSSLSGGHDGSAASLHIDFSLGEVTAQGAYVLDTAPLSHGYHRLRIVAYDGSPAQVAGTTTAPLFVMHDAPHLPTVALPKQLGPASGAIEVPVTAEAGITHVDIVVDGRVCASSAAAPFTVTLPLTGLGRGTHDLWAESTDADGNRYVTAPVPLEVLVPPDVVAIKPDHAVLTGGTLHRLTGTGFMPGCTVRLAGIPARAVKVISPNQLEVVSGAATPQRAAVEVTNPDGTFASLANSFEYYQPIVAKIQIMPAQDTVMPGHTASFSTSCLDQFGHAIADAQLTWSTSDGKITPEGIYTAPNTPGIYTLRVRPADSKQSWGAKVTVGPAPVKDGVLRHWLVIGPFPDPQNTALETSQLPEATITPSHDDRQDAFSWRSLFSTNDFIGFHTFFTPNTNAVAYAHVYVYAPAETPCTLLFGSDDGIRVWLNGEQLYSLRVRRAAAPNQDRLPVTLHAGWNRLLVKVNQASGPWGLYMRVQTNDGKPLDGLFYSLDRPDADRP